MRAPGREDPMNNGIDEVALSGHFSITPRLKATDGMMLTLYLREAEDQIDPCPWRVAGCGTEVVPREAVTTNAFIDTWLWIINRWLDARGYELGGLVRFRGSEAGDEGVITYDARYVLMRL